MGCQTPSAADQLPAGSAEADEDARTSLRAPEGKEKSMRLSPVARAFSVAVPVSLSEPAMRRAVPASVTSATAAPPVSAFKAPCKTGVVCVADCRAEPQGESKKMADKELTMISRRILSSLNC